LVPVEGWPVKIAGMNLTLTGAVNKSTTSTASGTFNFTLIPAGDYVISVTDWDYGMTKQRFTAPSGKAIKITLKGSCPYLYVWTGENYEQENDIYSVARVFPSELMTDQGREYANRDGLFLQQISVENISTKLIQDHSYRDIYQIMSPLKVDKEGNYRLLIRERAFERSFSDLLELWAIDHKAGLQTAVTRRGRLFSYATLYTLNYTREETKEVALYNNEILEITLPAEAFEAGFLAIDWQGFQDGSGKGQSSASGHPRIFLERLNPDGHWQTIDWVYPRDESQTSFFALDNLGTGWDKENKIRLKAWSCHPEKYHRIDRVSWGHALKETPESKKLILTSAIKSNGENVSTQTLATDGESVFLAPDEEVYLTYKSTPLAKDSERSFIFISKGIYIPMPMVRLLSNDL